MSKTWKVYFSLSSLLIISLVGILIFTGIQRNEQTPAITALIVLLSLLVLTLIFFLLKIFQKKIKYWIRAVNKTILIFTILLTLLSLALLSIPSGNFQETDTLVNLFLVLTLLWGLFASVTLIKLLNTEKAHFKSKKLSEILTSIDKKVDTFSDSFVKNHPTIAVFIALTILVGISIYLYVILGIPIGPK